MSELIQERVAIPKFSSVIFNIDGDEIVSEDHRGDMIPVKMASSHAIIIYRPEYKKHRVNHFSSVKMKLKNKGFSDVDILPASDDIMEFIIHSYEKDSSISMEGATEAETEFTKLITECFKAGASDIHMIRKENDAEIKIRVDGEIQSLKEWTISKADEVVQLAYNVKGINKEVSWDRNRTQNTDIDIEIDGNMSKLRYEHSPSKDKDSWHAVFRLIKQDTNILTLNELGYSEKQIEAIMAMLDHPSGLLLLSGETGAGKSTTIQTILSTIYKIHEGKVMIETIEDPPEGTIVGAVQAPVVRVKDKNEANETVNFFAKAVRSCMRRDPDIISIGEIRDGETCKALISAVQSGHWVITTIHANSALGALSRLEDLGVPKEIMATPGFFAGVVHQGLVSVLATNKVQTDLEGIKKTDERLYKNLVGTENLNEKFYIRGSSVENRNGIKGRTLLAETVLFNEKMLGLIKEGDHQGLRNYWMSSQSEKDMPGMSQGITIKRNAVDKINEGILSVKDAVAKAGPLNVD